jgi:MarR family transcriptional regulator, transcriptional regulator for hemolysin
MRVRSKGMPVGLQVARTAKAVSRAFNDALAEAGGSLPMWLVLSQLKGREWPAQLELARALDIEGPTLTRHLDGLESAGLVKRIRDPANRRAVRVELTGAGQAKHTELLQAVIAFNRRLRSGFDESEIRTLLDLLERLDRNIRGAGDRQERMTSSR